MTVVKDQNALPIAKLLTDMSMLRSSLTSTRTYIKVRLGQNNQANFDQLR